MTRLQLRVKGKFGRMGAIKGDSETSSPVARHLIEVFLSSTAKDLEDHRRAIHAELSSTGVFHCVWQEDFGPQDAGAVEFCRNSVRQCELFLGLVGLRR